MTIKNNCLSLLAILSVIVLLNTGCSTIVGTKVSSSVTPGINIQNYSRFQIKSNKDQLAYQPAKQALLEQGFIPYDGSDKTEQILVSTNENYGLCFPRFNTQSLLWIQFMFPTNASITLKDAKNLTPLIEVNYERGYFSLGPGKGRAKDELRNQLYKTLKELKLSTLPKPIKMNN